MPRFKGLDMSLNDVDPSITQLLRCNYSGSVVLWVLRGFAGFTGFKYEARLG